MRAGRPTIEARLLPAVLCAVLTGAARPAPPAPRDACILPERSAPSDGESVGVGLYDGAAFPGVPSDWRPAEVRDFFLVDAAGRLDLRDRIPADGPAMPRVALRSPGTAVVALVGAPAYGVLPAREFQSRLKAEGLDDILEMRATLRATGAPGRERSRHYLKTLLNAGGAATDVALANLSLVLEIIPEAQPADVRPGGSLPIRVLFEGLPDAGGLLCADHAAPAAGRAGDAWCGRLDGRGRVAVPIAAPGWQRLKTARMRALAGDGQADWVSYRAALTFDVPSDRSPR